MNQPLPLSMMEMAPVKSRSTSSRSESSSVKDRSSLDVTSALRLRSFSTAALLIRLRRVGSIRMWIVRRSVAGMAATYGAKVYNPKSVHIVL